ncbi:MAG: hypothetical protein E7122_05355 [Bacteroidales bacterium]|nr:hypothetical protein [Bacteroidales bacterium]
MAQNRIIEGTCSKSPLLRHCSATACNRRNMQAPSFILFCSFAQSGRISLTASISAHYAAVTSISIICASI